LIARGDLDGSIEAFRKAVVRDPKGAKSRWNLGLALQARGEVDAAIDAFREAVQRDPRDEWVQSALGAALRLRGSLEESVNTLEKAAKLLPKSGNIAAELRSSRRWVELNPRVPDIVADRAKPANPREAVEIALLCAQRFHKHYAAAYRLYLEAFAADKNLEPMHRAEAAIAAVLYAAGNDVASKPSPDEAAEARQRALTWLRAELELARQALASRDPNVHYAARIRLSISKRMPELASVRDAAGLAALPAAQRQPWEQWWAQVDGLLDSPPPK
jgi:tetratricopeptide (TPR) repeat protein